MKVKTIALMVGIMCVIASGFCTQSLNAAEKVITGKFAHVAPPSHPWSIVGEKFVKLVETNSKGRIKIKYYPSGTLGSEYSNIDALKMGTIDFTLIASPQMAAYSPVWQVLEGPYLFRDRAHAYKVLDGDIGQDLIALALEKGVGVLSWWEIGMAQVINSKRPIEKLSDMKGLKIRVMNSKFLVGSMAAQGAIPTPMAYTEVYSALQQGVVDGEQNPTTSILAGKRAEVCKYLAMTNQYYSCAPLLYNPKWMAKLPPDLQKIVKDAALETSAFIRKYVEEKEKEALQALESENGVQVTYPDTAEFEEATKVVYKEFSDIVPIQWVERIRAVK